MRILEPMHLKIKHLMSISVAAFLMFCVMPVGHADQKIIVALDKAEVIKLDEPASTVSVSNPSIADINVQSPRVIFVIGKAIGETSINVLTKSGNTARSFDVNVIPSTNNKITVNLGSDGVKTLNCLPRCVQISNPGKDPAAKSSSSSGTAQSGGSGSAQPVGSISQ